MSSLFKQYGIGTPVGVLSNDGRTYFFVYSEQWFDAWPQYLINNGMTCQQARDYISANWKTISFDFGAGIITIPRLIVKQGSTMPACAGLIQNGGTGGLFQTQVDPGVSPIIEVGGVSYPGACTPDPNYPVDGTWGLFRFQSFVGVPATQWVPSIEVISAVDINKWFCNDTSCCGSALPIGGGSSFLIPGAPMAAPVQEKSTIPLIKTPVYLTNHTWAFRNNFGRLPK